MGSRRMLLAAAGLALAGALLLWPAPGQPDPPQATGPAAPVVGASPAALPVPADPAGTDPAPVPGHDEAHGQQRGQPQEQPWWPVAAGFAAAWPAAGPGDGWLEGLRPWTGRFLLEQLALADPARRPAGELVAVEPVAVGPFSAVVRAEYGRPESQIELTVLPGTDGQWEVVDVLPADGGKE